MGGPEDSRTNLAWSALFVVASVFGGLAAADITHESSLIAVLFSLLVAIIMVILLYQGFLDERPGAERRLGGEHRTAPLPRQEPAGVPAGQGRGAPLGGAGAGMHRSGGDGSQVSPRRAAESPVQPGVVKVVQPSGGGEWWQSHVAATSPAPRSGPGAQPASRQRKVDLSQFLDQALIAQCPRCGAFAVDVDNRGPEWLFACLECPQRWTWQPGTPWPGVQVRPEARGREDY
jgi:hypothetical protein